MISRTSPSGQLRRLWGRLGGSAIGRWVFGRLFGFVVPYSGTVSPRFLELSPGHARIAMDDGRGVRNHLASIHALALANLAEMTTGLALGYAMPDGMRSILTRLTIEWVKKSRGTITATCDAPIPEAEVSREYGVEAVLTDEAGDVVARATAYWLVGPIPPKGGKE